MAPYAVLPKIHLFDDISGTMANDFAIKAALIKHHERVTGKVLDYCNIWEDVHLPKPDYKIISFSGAHHGTSIATLSASTHHQKFNLPNYPFIILDYPKAKDVEKQALEAFEKAIKSHPE